MLEIVSSEQYDGVEMLCIISSHRSIDRLDWFICQKDERKAKNLSSIERSSWRRANQLFTAQDSRSIEISRNVACKRNDLVREKNEKNFLMVIFETSTQSSIHLQRLIPMGNEHAFRLI